MTGIEIVGHRAYRGRYPENTRIAFDKAVEAGVDVIETDLQMSHDGVVVVNHDVDTGRMWNQTFVIKDTPWERLSQLHCNVDGYQDQKMLTLRDALQWLMDRPTVKLMLDIKFTNEKLILQKTLAEMRLLQPDLQFWRSRIIWGLWKVDWYRYAVETGVIKDFDVVCISLSLQVARAFVDYSESLKTPHYKLHGISVHYVSTWSHEFQSQWFQIIQNHGIKVYVWTINKESDFKYCGSLPISGYVTDFPQRAKASLAKYKKPGKQVFQKPAWNSIEGIRFYVFLAAYIGVQSMVFWPWSHVKIIGQWSLSYVVLRLLRWIHFL
ncbi:LAMI_0G10308g1_1 [Lachancea mirantina]|uniref:LAMI_0G10308g1_1 n=1 Tax=Lachancea mirantina TaxID=1230905 RepID=A0A1G4KAL3_9SACH|nr:LAMI_0G10308g1_1 [Lachancea mirantina]